ncbi:MAG: peroxiredoxin Q/BCP [Hyphomicrobiaceae bacterium]|jgi:peroxiredoxin Q/BCP
MTRSLTLIALLLSFLIVGTPDNALAKMLSVGDPFPAWELRDHTGHPFASSELAGKRYLLWYYPKAMTPGCTKEGRALAAEEKAFAAAGIEILGVSFDDPIDNAEFVRSELFPFRLLSDTERSLAMAVGAADTTDAKYARRISYVVGVDGKVEKVYDAVNPAKHAKDVLGNQ